MPSILDVLKLEIRKIPRGRRLLKNTLSLVVLKINLIHFYSCYSHEVELHRESESSPTYRCKLLQCGDGQWPLYGIWSKPKPGPDDGRFGPRRLLSFPRICRTHGSLDDSDARHRNSQSKQNPSTSSPPPRRHCYDCRNEVATTPFGAPPASYICTCGPHPRQFPRAPIVNFHIHTDIFWYRWSSCLRLGYFAID